MKKHLYLPLAGFLAVGLHAMAAEPDADNTGKNARDTPAEAVTPTDQSNAPKDLQITADTRRAVVAEKDFSVDAKNVKIITADSVVTLRGPVASKEEKMKIEQFAVQSGAIKVVNQIEVKVSQ